MGSALGRVVVTEHTQDDPQPGRGSTPQGSRSCATGRASTPQRSRFRSRILLIWGVAGSSMGQELLLAPPGVERLATAAPKGTDTRGFFGNPPEKDDAGVRVGEDSDERTCGCLAGRSWKRSGRWTEPGRNGNRGDGDGDGDVCPWGVGHMSLQGCRLWLRGVVKFSLKC